MTKNENNASWIVTVGASAGGLESIERFFTNCPGDLGVAFVVIQHLSSHYKSMMDDLIGRYTSMPVHMVENGQVPQQNEIYLIPAGKLITMENGCFNVVDKSEDTLSLPIDIFLKSLAADASTNAIAIILSGTGSDGSRGALSVNAEGGLVLAQSPEDAKFDGMPRSVIETGIVDGVVVADQMPQRIAQHIDAPFSFENTTPIEEKPGSIFQVQDDFESILHLLNARFGINFLDYKWATVSRRVERRMQVRHLSSLAEYHEKLQEDSEELAALRREILIPVTNFFRDREVFDHLEKNVIPQLVKKADQSEGLRVWVAGCSTGEEAYSLAMLFLEEMESQKNWCPIKIFATDVNPDVIDIAGQGNYPDSIAGEVPERLLKKYFMAGDEIYKVKPEVRQAIVFARHNILVDPPFTNIDLVTCRNTLIYLKSASQVRALHKLEYALKEGGFLLLGKSEALSTNVDKFKTVSSKLKIYQCLRSVMLADIDFRSLGSRFQKLPPAESVLKARVEVAGPVKDGLDLLHNRYLPCAFLVDESMDVIHFFGEPGALVKIRKGAPSNTLNFLLNDKLVPLATTLFYRIKKSREFAHTEPIQVALTTDGPMKTFRISGEPVPNSGDKPSFLIIIEEEEQASKLGSEAKPLELDTAAESRINQLELELSATRESLQATIEELETTNEELQATNEELMASNEELQSSNEELQSVNEELNTVNSEYHQKMEILNQTNADLDAMTQAAAIATIFVDENGVVTRFTPDAADIFYLRDGDVGRKLEEVSHRLSYDLLFDDIDKTFKSGRMLERKVVSVDGRSILTRIVPYSLSTSMRGCVISFIDVTVLDNLEQLQSVMDALPEHIAVLNPAGQIMVVNRAWQIFGAANGVLADQHDFIGSNYLDVCSVGPGDDETGQRAREGIKAVLEGSRDRFALEYPCHSDDEKRWFAMEVVAIPDNEFRAVVSHFNISAWKRALPETYGQDSLDEIYD